MLNTFSFFTLCLVAIISVIVTLLIAFKIKNSTSTRTNMLWPLFILNDIVFLIGIALIAVLEPQTKLTLLSWLVYDLIFAFSISIEFPGWYKLSKLDESRNKVIVALRTVLIKMRYSFDQQFENFKKLVNDEKIILEEEELEAVISDFVTLCEDSDETWNESLWALTLGEITERINEINSRSKHPIPKLIDILALSGLSVLIAELLKVIG